MNDNNSNNDDRKESEMKLTLAYKHSQDIKRFEQELYSLGAKHNIFILINYDN